jgi:hypothetical protein
MFHLIFLAHIKKHVTCVSAFRASIHFRHQKNPYKQAGFEVLTAAIMKTSIFRDIMLRRPLQSQPTFRRIIFTPPSMSNDKSIFILVSCWVNSWTVKTEAKCYFETSVYFQWTTWRYTLEEKTPQTIYIYSFIYICVGGGSGRGRCV